MDQRLLKDASPTLYEELAPKLNLDPEKIRAKSRKEVWWMNQACGHTWAMCPRARFDLGYGCAICSGQRIVPGINDFATTDPWIMAYWDSSSPVTVHEISRGSKKLITLLFPTCGHRKEITPNHLIKIEKLKCEECDSIVYIDKNASLKREKTPLELRDYLFDEWDSRKNNLSLETEGLALRESFWWLCPDFQHSWQCSLNRRLKGEDPGCSICRGTKLLTDFNDLATKFPQLASQWDLEKNTTRPEKVLPGSNTAVWWLCEFGHSWKTPPNNRKNGTNCPLCAKGMSKLEKKVVDFIESIYDGPILQRQRPLRRKDKRALELDIWLPELRLAFEVQDLGTHSRETDGAKSSWRGIPITKKGPTYHELKRTLALEQLGVNVVDIWEDLIKNEYYKKIIENSVTSALEA